jgi:pantothenate kinase
VGSVLCLCDCPCCREDIVISNDNNSEKNEILDNVFDAFFSYYPDGSIDGLYENLSSMKDSVDKACDYAIDMISEVGTVWDVFDQVDRFSTEFHSNKVLDDSEAWLYSLFDGSLLYFLSCINSTAMLPADEAVILSAVNKQFDELKDFFEKIKKDFRENCTEWDKESRYSMFAEEEAVSSEA